VSCLCRSMRATSSSVNEISFFFMFDIISPYIQYVKNGLVVFGNGFDFAYLSFSRLRNSSIAACVMNIPPPSLTSSSLT